MAVSVLHSQRSATQHETEGESVKAPRFNYFRPESLSEAVRLLEQIGEAMPYVAHVAVRNRGTFGGSIALADPSAEMPACVLALGASLVVESVRGRRTISADEFFLDLYETAREPD